MLVACGSSKFKAGMNSVILRYWHGSNYNVEGFVAVLVDGETIKPDTWYQLKDGKFVEADE